MLETPGKILRDVVLLTHPRNLREADVLTAARRFGRDRLFVVTLDAHGEAEVSEVRRGAPIRLRHFHVEFVPSLPTPQIHLPKADAKFLSWTGEVETIPFPFRLGTEAHVKFFDFDFEGRWLLTVSGQACLHLWHLDGTRQETLPRPCLLTVMKEINGLQGVRGGFVVTGSLASHTILAHFDVVRRHCTLYRVFHTAKSVDCYCATEQNNVIVSDPETGMKRIIDLDTETLHDVHADLPARVNLAWSKYSSGKVSLRDRIFVHPYLAPLSQKYLVTSATLYPNVHMDPASGEIEFFFNSGRVSPNLSDLAMTPVSNGKPCFQGADHFVNAQQAGSILALRARPRHRRQYHAGANCRRGCRARVSHPPVRPENHRAHALSRWQSHRPFASDHRVEVEAVWDRGIPNLRTRLGGYTRDARLYVWRTLLPAQSRHHPAILAPVRLD